MNKILATLIVLSAILTGSAHAYVRGGAGAGATSCPGTTWASLTGTPPAGVACYISDAASCTVGTQVSSSGSTPCVLSYVNGGWYPAGGSTGQLPAVGNACNLLTDNGAAWVSVTPGGDLVCGGSLGQLTLAAQEGVPYTGSPLSGSSTNGFRCTDGSGHMVVCNAATDPGTTVGDMLYLSTAGTPNTYSRLAATTQGDILTTNGATTAPTFSVNEAPLPISFTFDGTISSSEARYRVCPVTLRVAPGFATSYPFVASQATIGTNTGETDTYTLTDVTNSNTSVGTATVTTGGVWTFATTNCSSSFDGTQGTTAAWGNSGSAVTSMTKTVPTISAGDGIIVACYSASNGTFTTPSGYSAITNGAASGGTSSVATYEKNAAGGDSGATVTCANSSSAAMSEIIITVKGVPTSGEIVDVAAAVRGGSSTTINAPSVTSTHNGERILQGAISGNSFTVSSWSPANTNIATSVNGAGAQSLVQGTAGATGAATATWSSAALAGAFQIALLNSATSCTLCTAGDQMKLAVGTASGDDANISFIGVK